jgi:hypothetical protein
LPSSTTRSPGWRPSAWPRTSTRSSERARWAPRPPPSSSRSRWRAPTARRSSGAPNRASKRAKSRTALASVGRATAAARVFFVGWLALAAGAVGATCPPAASDRAALDALARSEWKLVDDGRRQALAIELLDCLASPDPKLRDDVAFAAIQHWSRARQLAPATLQTIRATLVARLTADDPAGFARPFAALGLAEVARADRVTPFLSADERATLVRAGTAYLAGVRDYRGFDEREGWRHGVAHGADLVLQLAVHPALDRAQLDALLAAVAAQVMPAGHFYIYGEGDRLMAPVFYIGRRDVLSADEWSAWFAALAARLPRGAPTTQGALAARHDLAAFLLPLDVSLREQATPEMQARMLPGVTAALRTLD